MNAMSNQMRILHVEDDFADAMLLQHALQEAGALDLEIVVSRTLVDAKYKLMDKSFDLVITDLRLPDSNTSEDTIRIIEKHAGDTPVIALTGAVGPNISKVGEDIVVLNKNVYLQDRDERTIKTLHDRIMDVYVTEQDTLEL